MATPEPRPLPQAGASLADLLTAVKNLVVAVNALTTVIIQINGQSTAEGIASPTVVKASPGRVASVSIIKPGSGTGIIYDSNSVNTMTAPLWIIPDALPADGEPYTVNMATNSGILVVPGMGQVVTVNWA